VDGAHAGSPIIKETSKNNLEWAARDAGHRRAGSVRFSVEKAETRQLTGWHCRRVEPAPLLPSGGDATHFAPDHLPAGQLLPDGGSGEQVTLRRKVFVDSDHLTRILRGSIRVLIGADVRRVRRPLAHPSVTQGNLTCCCGCGSHTDLPAGSHVSKHVCALSRISTSKHAILPAPPAFRRRSTTDSLPHPSTSTRLGIFTNARCSNSTHGVSRTRGEHPAPEQRAQVAL
jgi:hypothetical protein